MMSSSTEFCNQTQQTTPINDDDLATRFLRFVRYLYEPKDMTATMYDDVEKWLHTHSPKHRALLPNGNGAHPAGNPCVAITIGDDEYVHKVYKFVDDRYDPSQYDLDPERNIYVEDDYGRYAQLMGFDPDHDRFWYEIDELILNDMDSVEAKPGQKPLFNLVDDYCDDDDDLFTNEFPGGIALITEKDFTYMICNLFPTDCDHFRERSDFDVIRDTIINNIYYVQDMLNDEETTIENIAVCSWFLSNYRNYTSVELVETVDDYFMRIADDSRRLALPGLPVLCGNMDDETDLDNSKLRKTVQDELWNRFNTLCQSTSIVPRWETTFQRSGQPSWLAKLTVFGKQFNGKMTTKMEAKTECLILFFGWYDCPYSNFMTVTTSQVKSASVDSDISIDLVGNSDTGVTEDTAATSGLDVVSADSEGNTTITTGRGESHAQVVLIPPPANVHNFMDGGLLEYPELTSRFLNAGTIEWSTTDEAGAILTTMHMPRDLLSANRDSPNILPFFQHMYSVPQQTIRAQGNATKFHSGTLAIAARYNSSPDAGHNITHASQLLQMPHVLIQASSANSTDFSVPFMYVTQFLQNLNIRTGAGCYYWTLYVGVINPLGVGDGGSSTVTIQLYSNLMANDVHTKFAMQRTQIPLFPPSESRRVNAQQHEAVLIGNMDILGAVAGVGQVIGTVTNVVGGLINGIEGLFSGVGSMFRTSNMDRPTLPVDRPTMAIYGSTDLALGDGSIDLISFRIDKRNLTPHVPEIVSNEKQFDFTYIKRVKAWTNSFEWSASDPKGKQLYMEQITYIDKMSISGGALYAPYSEILSNFLYMRGNKLMNFLFGASQMHSGRIIVVVSPDANIVPTLDNMYSFPYVIFDLEEQQTFEFVVPNVCPTHLTPVVRRDRLGDILKIYAYGRVYVLVETPLKLISSISSTISCAILHSAHENMQFHGLAPGYIESVATDVPDFRRRLIGNSGGSGFISGMPNPNSSSEERTSHYQTLSASNLNDTMEHTVGENFNINNSCRRFNKLYSKALSLTDGGSLGIIYDINAGTLEVRAAAERLDIVSQLHDAFRFFKGGMRYFINISDPNVVMTITHAPGVFDYQTTVSSGFNPNGTLISHLGYANQPIIGQTNTSLTFEIPYMNQNNFLVNEYDPRNELSEFAPNRYSNGQVHIALQNDTGVERAFRMEIWRALSDDAAMYAFQGFPLRVDRNIDVLNVTDPGTVDPPTPPPTPPTAAATLVLEVGVEVLASYATGESDHLFEGTHVVPLDGSYYEAFNPDGLRRGVGDIDYANTLVFDTDVTVVVNDVNVTTSPFDLTTLTDDQQVIVRLAPTLEGNCQDFRSDASIPFSKVLDEVCACGIKVPRRVRRDPLLATQRKQRATFNRIRKLIFFTDYNLEGNMDRVRNFVSGLNPLSSLNTSAASVAESFSGMGETLSNFTADMRAGGVASFEWFTNLCTTATSTLLSSLGEVFIGAGERIANAVLSFYHIFFSHEHGTKVAAFIQVLLSLGIVSITKIRSLITCLKSLFVGSPTVVGNADEMDDGATEERINFIFGWFKTLVPFALAAFGFQSKWSTLSMKHFYAYIRESVKFSNDISTFFHRNLDFLKNLAEWTFNREHPEVSAVAVLRERREEMETWAKESLKISQGHYRDRVFASSGLQKHLDLLYQQGTEYLSIIRDKNLDTTAFMAVFRKISDLHQAIGQRVGVGRLVKEPICLWFYGESGIGKSHVAPAVALRMMESWGIVYDGPAVYTRNFTSFWNNWADQPCVLYDDFAQNTSPEALNQLVSEVFSLLSIAEYNPEMPAIEDKNRMVNPELIVCCSNQACPRLNVVACQAAFRRRRDFVVQVELAEEFKTYRNANDLSISNDDLAKYNHLRFTVMDTYADGVVRKNASGLTYDQLCEYLVKESAGVRVRRSRAAIQRLEQGSTLSPQAWTRRMADPNGGVSEVVRRAVVSTMTVLESDQSLTEAVQASTSYAASSYASVAGNCDYCVESDTGVRDVVPAPVEFGEFSIGEDRVPDYVCFCDIIVQRAQVCAHNYCYYLTSEDYTFRINAGDQPARVFIRLDQPCSDVCINGGNYTGRLRRFNEAWEARYHGQVPNPGTYLYDAWMTNGDFQLPVATLEQLQQRPDMEFNRPSTVSAFARWMTRVCSITKTFFTMLSVVGLCVIFAYCLNVVLEWVCSKSLERVGVCAAIALTTAVHYIGNVLFSRILRQLVGNLAVSGDVRTMGATPGRAAIPHLAGNMDEATLCFSRSERRREMKSSIYTKIAKNTIKLVWVKDGKCISGSALVLAGRTVIAPYHYFAKAASFGDCDLEIWVRRSLVNSSTYKFTASALTPRRLAFMDTNQGKEMTLDLCYFELPPTVGLFSDIRGLFASEDQCSINQGRYNLIQGWTKDAKVWYDTRTFDAVKMVQLNSSYDDINVFLLGYGYPYADSGACASVLFADKIDKIVGFHTTGYTDGSEGYSTVICSKTVQCIPVMSLIAGTAPDGLVCSDEVPKLELRGQCASYGRLRLSHRVRVNTKTAIRPSRLVGTLCQPKRFPAKLSLEGEPVPGYGPLQIGVEKQLKPPLQFPQWAVDVAKNDLSAMLKAKAKPVQFPAISERKLDEAIAGVPGMPFAEGIRLNTSPGFPLCVTNPGTHKKDFIKVDIDGDSRTVKIDKRLQKIYDEDHEQRVGGVVPFTCYTDFLKDERLKPGKATRLINGCSVQETIEWRRYCMDFFSAFQTAGVPVGSAIGINMFGKGMDVIVRHLLEVGPCILTGDYSSFGPTIQPAVMVAISQIVQEWYEYYTSGQDSHCSVIRQALFESLISCRHVAGDHMYETVCGAPSGNPYTAPINTLANLLYLRVCWLCTFENSKMQGLDNFHKYSRHVTYGDDYIGVIDSRINKLFNNNVMMRFFNDYGIGFTDAQKSSNPKDYDRIEEASFLKCYPVFNSDYCIWRAAMTKDVLEDIINWYREPCPDMWVYLKEVATYTLYFAFSYGEEYFNTVSKKLENVFIEAGEFFPHPVYSDLSVMFMEGEGFEMLERLF